MTAIFIFSTIFTLAYYWNQGANTQLATPGLSDNGKSITDSGSWLIDFLDSVLEILSWISPFALVKLLLVEVMSNTPELYTALNLLILRPVSWIFSVITANYVISKIPTVSGET